MKQFMIALILSGLCLVYAADKKQIVIIIPDKANSVEKTAAGELAYYLDKATGEKLPIVTESKISSSVTGGFKLGKVKDAPDISERQAGTFRFNYQDGFLYISGHDGMKNESSVRTSCGTLFGVYYYLHHVVGVRWLWPGISGEYIPHIENLELNNNLDGVYPPKFQFVQAANLIKNPDAFRWGRRVMHMDSSQIMVHAGTGGHAFGSWGKEYGKDHPEWFAMRKNGKRNTNSHAPMCISNSGFHDQIVKLWDEAQKKSGSKLFINVKENDTQNRCVCEKCLSWDGPDKRGPTGRYALHRNVGERYARFYHSVWEKAMKADPEAKLSFYAYQSYFYAPRETRLNRGFYVGLVPDVPFPRRSEYNDWLRKEYHAWRDSGATIYFRPNYFFGGYCMPEVWYDQYASEFKFIKDIGCVGVNIDGPGNMWATRGLDYYVMGRLCVEPEADPEKLTGEYYGAFGAAASDIKKYFEYFRDYLKENTNRINEIYESSQRKWYFHGFHYAAYAHEIFPEKVLAKGRQNLDVAAAKVADDISARTKVEFLRQGIEYALASVKCAEIFADSKTNNEQRKLAWDNLHKLRETLPPHAVNSAFLDRIEKNVWQVISWGNGDVQTLPENWNVMPDPENRGDALGYSDEKFDDSKWKQASTWKHLEGQGYSEYTNMWYRTMVHIAEKSSEKVILHLGAVDESCEVWINGIKAGSFRYDSNKDTRSWEKPQEFDITSAVKFGGNNIICVKLINHIGGGGIWKPSCLIYRGRE